MKKLLTLSALFLCVAMGMNAQEKKAWNFFEGLSDETIANLTADKTNWADNGTDADGNVINWKNAVKQDADGYWMANGEVIEELRVLKIDVRKNKDNSMHLATTKLRLTRKSTKITFPKLANGQKITIQGRSANSTANNRGIAPVQSYIQFQPEESSSQYNGACIFLGNQVEGSEGTYTFVWKVVTEETDSVDVQFTLTPDAGIDFYYFMIDNGDAPEVQEAQPVAYIYDGDLDSDYAYIYLSGDSRFALTEINAAETTATADSLQKFQAVVVSPTIAADNAYVSTIKQAIAYVPMLNFNPYLYEAWGYGKTIATESPIMGGLKEDFEGFEGVDINDGILELLTDGTIVGVELGEYFADDQILAYANPDEGIIGMHAHNSKRNAYVLLPLTLENMLGANQDVIATLIPQVLQAVANTKKEVVATGTPVIAVTQEDGFTTVKLSATNSNAIYYTLDGSDPTTESTLYTEPFNLYQAATVKAMATGDGYTNSKIAEKDIVIMVQASTPTITIESNADGKAVISLQSPQGIDMYYNFNGATTADDSQLYTEPIVLTESATLYTLAQGGEWLPSNLAEKEIAVNGFNGRTNIISHFDANEADWFVDNSENGGDGKASAYYYWGKSAWNYYGDELDHEETVKDIEGNDSIVYVYKPNAEALKEIRPNTENGWVLRSRGQVLTGELQLKPETGVGNGRTSRYFEEALDQLTTPSTGVITFGAKISGEPYTASIETTEKLQGPFDIVVMCGNGNGSGYGVLEIQTSADGENWVKVDTLKMAGTQRYIKRTRASYEGTDQVYVRVAQTGGGTKAQVYDIIVLNGEGEKVITLEDADVNSDKTVDVADISAILTVMSGDYSTFTLENADVNGDGTADVADISAVLTFMAK